jgi:hypothetical protein
VEAIKKFIQQSEYEPSFVEFQEQGSWAHDTIIKPLNGDEFDADLLLVVDPVDGWTASDYVTGLGKIFRDSPTYKEKTKVYEFCVTLVYGGDKRIDIAPLIKDRGGIIRYEVLRLKFQVQHPEPSGHRMLRWTDEVSTSAARNVA